jgi:hypothetical protein
MALFTDVKDRHGLCILNSARRAAGPKKRDFVYRASMRIILSSGSRTPHLEPGSPGSMGTDYV